MILIIFIIIPILIYFILKNFLSKKVAISVTILTPVIMFFGLSSTLFFLFYQLIKEEDNRALANDDKSSVLEMYTDALTEYEDDTEHTFQKILSDMNTTPVSNTGNNGGNTTVDSSYQNTVNEAQKIEGSSLLHEIHNLLVKTANDFSSTRGFNYEFMLGVNFTESTGLVGNPWIPHISAPAIAVQQKPDFDLYTWGVSDLFDWLPKAENGFLHGSADNHIGAFQVYYGDFNGNSSKPNSSWGKSEWVNFVNGSGSQNDGNGDGKSDPFNFYDAALANARHAAPKPNLMKEAWVKPGDGEQEMYMMLLATRYVGSTAVRGSRVQDDGTLSAHNEWPTYVHVEGKNPHVDMMRHAYNEWKNNGPIFQEYKNWMEGQTTTSSNGDVSAAIIDKLYAKNGWTKNGKSQTYHYPDGTYTKIEGYGGQFVYYPIRVFWGGKIAAENIQKVLNGGS